MCQAGKDTHLGINNFKPVESTLPSADVYGHTLVARTRTVPSRILTWLLDSLTDFRGKLTLSVSLTIQRRELYDYSVTSIRKDMEERGRALV